MESPDQFEGDEDAQLRYAIALSLQEAQPSATREQPIELSSDDDDETESGSPSTTSEAPDATSDSPSKPKSPQNAVSQPTSAAPTYGIAGLDRRKMEEERLARIAKRKAPDSEQESPGRSQRPKPEPTAPSEPPASLSRVPLSDLPFPHGVVKKTWVKGYPRLGDDIKIDEILQKDKLELAVISSFQWDDEWMLSKIDTRRTKLMLVTYASSREHQQQIEENAPRGRVRFCFPPMMGAGSMHSKLQLLKYPNYLRIVVPSGNFVPYDWGETGVMENIAFIIDLPRIVDPEALKANKLTPFGEELCFFLQAQGLEQSLVLSLQNYDFSETLRYSLVHTIGQSHVAPDAWARTGYCGLGRAVKALGLSSENVQVDYVTATMGSLNDDLLTALYFAAQGKYGREDRFDGPRTDGIKGDDGMKEYNKRTANAGKGRGKGPAAPSKAPFPKAEFHIYFPSHETVARSRGGTQAGGTISVQSKWWHSTKFPRDSVCDCVSVRTGLLMHSKIIFVRGSDDAEGSRSRPWAYIGSANLSESAWGRMVKDKQSGRPKLNCRNWECGVIVPAEQAQSAPGGLGLSREFEGIVPVPMQAPGEPYGQTGSKRPWLFLENA